MPAPPSRATRERRCPSSKSTRQRPLRRAFTRDSSTIRYTVRLKTDRHTDRQTGRQAGMARVAATAVARRANTILAASSRSQRLRRQGRIPSDSDVKEAHRRTYQDNESLRSGLTAGEEQSTSRDDDPRVQGGISEGASTSDQSPKASSALEVHGGSDQASKAAVLIDIMLAIFCTPWKLH